MHVPVWSADIFINRRWRHFTAGHGAASPFLCCLPVRLTRAPPPQAADSAASVPSKPRLFLVVGNAREESSRLMERELQDFGSYQCLITRAAAHGVLAPAGSCTGVASPPRPSYGSHVPGAPFPCGVFVPLQSLLEAQKHIHPLAPWLC